LLSQKAPAQFWAQLKQSSPSAPSSQPISGQGSQPLEAKKNNMSASPDIWSAEIGFFMAIPLFFSCQLRFRVDNIMHILQA
jgi:hypothetical protein